MAKKSDGTVLIDTLMDTSGFDKGMTSVEQKVSTVRGVFGKLGRTIKNTFSSNEIVNASKEYEQLSAEIAETEALIEKLIEKQNDNASVVKAYKDVQKEISKTEAQLDKLHEKQMRFVKIGGNIDSQAFKGMDYDVQLLSSKLDELEQELSSISSVNPDIIGKGVANNIELTKAKLEELRLKQEQVNQSASSQQAVSKFPVLREAIARVGNAAASAAINVLKLTGKGLSNGIKKLGATLKNVAKNILSIGKNSKVADKSMLKMLGTSILFSSVFRAINTVLNGFKEGMNNLVQYSDEVNGTMSALKSSLTQLKNSFATAFAPLLTMVIPILKGFSNAMSQTTSIVGAFFSALSGKGTYTKAMAVQEDYAASLDKTASSAKKAQKYLTGLDEIKTFTSNSEDSTAGVVSPENMFSEEQIDVSISSFADKVREAFNNIKELFIKEEWNSLGEYLASGINTALGYLYTALNWENVKEKIVPFIDGLTGTFNSFVDDMDLGQLGRTIGTGLNAIIHSINEFVAGIEWENLGTKLAEGLNGLVKEIDWSAAGKTLSNSIKGFLDLMINFLEETDWQQIGHSVAELLGTIDWNGIADKLFEGIGAALGGLTALLWGLIEEAWNEVVHWWHDVAFEDGKFTITGLLDGIWAVAKDIGNWLMEHVVNPFIDGIKEAFGINSPSTVMAEIGEYIIEGLKNGIKGSVNKVIDVLNILISGIVDGINLMISALNGLSFDVPSWVPIIGGETFGLNIPSVPDIKIPLLATGAVIPPNAPFMAVLGDQKHGTNIEAPLDTIKQAMREVVGSGTGGNYRFTAQINRRTLFDEVIAEAKLRQTNNGRNPFELA